MLNENQHTNDTSALEDFNTLRAKSKGISASKLLADMLVDSSAGDTLFSQKMMDAFDDEVVGQLEHEWSDFVQAQHGQSNLSIEDQARLALAEQRTKELALLRAMFAQVLGDGTDHSKEIEQLESDIYSAYSPAVHEAALREKIRTLEALELENWDLKTARAVLLDTLEAYANAVKEQINTSVELERPTPETLAAVEEWLTNRYGSILEQVDGHDTQIVDAVGSKYYFDLAIAAEPLLRDEGWRVDIVEREKNAVSVFSSERRIVISSQREATQEVTKGLIVHEVYGHALRSAMSEMLGNDIGRTGTASYGSFEESFLVALEQCLSKKIGGDSKAVDRYIGIGLAATNKVSPAGVGHVLASIGQFTDAKKDALDEYAVSRTDAYAKGMLGRTFAGMVDVDDGVVHKRDIKYLQGLDGAWKLLNYLVEKNDLEAGMRWLLSAKFNPYDEHDRLLVNQYMPMPESLETFFSPPRSDS